ncbi:integumentary mucin C.1-like, partial [Varroa jacobsoni]|uniref:integumentary mucin C.1-like n=1 Tax=Varroa jacobsoni TaxID=62625 RepID=UPI000BF38428
MGAGKMLEDCGTIWLEKYKYVEAETRYYLWLQKKLYGIDIEDTAVPRTSSAPSPSFSAPLTASSTSNKTATLPNPPSSAAPPATAVAAAAAATTTTTTTDTGNSGAATTTAATSGPKSYE